MGLLADTKNLNIKPVNFMQENEMLSYFNYHFQAYKNTTPVFHT